MPAAFLCNVQKRRGGYAVCPGGNAGSFRGRKAPFGLRLAFFFGMSPENKVFL